MSTSKFTIIGNRFTRVFFDESPLTPSLHERVNDAFTAQLEIQRVDPSISYSPYGERKVMELGVTIAADLTWEKDKGSKDERKERAFEVQFVCGLVGTDKKHDGDLDALTEVQDEMVRLIYLSKRDQVAALLADTWFGSVSLPHDLDFKSDLPKKSVAKATRKRAPRSK